jgi:putative hydrolase of the HAD superfamily
MEVIAFDGDDTLWHSESLFAVTQERFGNLLEPYIDTAALEAHLLEVERRNLELFGYGVKAFTLSMIETAITVSEGRITASDVATIVDWGKEMLTHPVELLDGVEETLRSLADQHRLALVTKGDLFHQESKVAGSGLGALFDHVAIVAEKDEQTYLRVTKELGVEPPRFLMVGNSPRSDVAPVVAIGAHAVHIPYHTTWALEHADLAAMQPTGRHHELQDIRQLPQLVTRLRSWSPLSGSSEPETRGGAPAL